MDSSINNLETIVQVITLALALWGAVISTILGVREIQKEKRQIKIFIEYIGWGEVYILRIVNIGQRPITIRSISVATKTKREGFTANEYEVIQDGFVFRESSTSLPKKLEDGDNLQLIFSDYMQQLLRANNGNAGIQVFDNEGNCYSNYKLSYFDAKYGYQEQRHKPSNNKRSLGFRITRLFRKK